MAYININNIKDKKNIFIFENDFNSNSWNFKKYMINKSTPSYSINFDLSQNNINLSEQYGLLDEIKTIIYNRFKSGIKIRTNIGYFHTISAFIKFMFDSGKTNLNELTNEDFELYKGIVANRQHLNALNSLFKYRSNTINSIQFKPYNENVKKMFKDDVSQTKILKETDWKKICKFAEKVVCDFNDNYKTENTYNKFIYDFYNLNGNCDLIRFDFKKEFNLSTVDMKKKRSDVISAAGMLIQAYTGMRLSEVLSLKRGCVIKEKITINDETLTIIKIKGITFKYQNSNGDIVEEGIETTWYGPEILVEAVKSLEVASKIYFDIFGCEDLFISPTTLSSIVYKKKLNAAYNKILQNNNVIDYEINSHMFRRTLARFFAKSVLDIPVEALKEQYKHFDKSITHYYMRDTEVADNSFIELMEDYSKELIKGNISKSEKISKFIKRNIKDAITTANNLEELNMFLGSKKIEIVNDYMATINKENAKLSPLECLTCEGNLILPELHLDYWNEMLILYKELLISEPNSFWYKKEYKQIQDVVDKLNKNEAYISKVNKQ